MRWGVWQAARTFLASGPLWVVATLTWWPAVFLFPLTAVVTYLSIRRLLPAGRPAQGRRGGRLDRPRRVHRGGRRRPRRPAHLAGPGPRAAPQRPARRRSSTAPSTRSWRSRCGSPDAAAGCSTARWPRVGVVGVALVLSGDLSTARLVTLFLVTTMFVGRRRHARPPPARPPGGLRRGAAAARHDGLARPSPRVACPCPTARSTSSSAHLEFCYGTGTFALRDVDLLLAAGHTCALVGRTGSGKSTLASLLSRAVEPPRGMVFLGGADVLDLDLQQLRSAVGVVTQRTEVLAGTLADNITLFDDVPAHGRRGGGRRARPDRVGRRAARRPRHRPRPRRHQPVRRARSSSSPSRGCWCATSASSSSTRPRPGWTPSPRPASSAPPTG